MAEEKKSGAKGEEEAPAAPRKILGLGLPQFLLVVVNLIAVGGSFGLVYHTKFVHKPPVITETQSRVAIKKETQAAEQKKLAADGELYIFTLPEMNVNLRSRVGGRNHYATLTVALKCNNAACEKEIETLRVKVEDVVQSLVAARSHTELSMSEASFRLKHEITRSVNALLKEGTITDTFFTDYTIQ